mgnify:CR=1 FL=1
MNSVVIFGRGQLGTFYKDYFEQKGVSVTSPIIDIRDAVAVRRAIAEGQPDVVINAAAKTNIDWCEQNKLESFHINSLGAENIGEACAEHGAFFVHLSSGCVQESKTAEDVWREHDPVSPVCYYSWTKVWAENLLNDFAKKNGLQLLILRPRQLLSSMVSPRNAVTKLLTYGKFIDMANSSTIVEDLMWVTDELIRRSATGIYNVVNPGIITPYQTALMLREVIKSDMQIQKVSKDELNAATLAKRIDSVLSTEKLNSLGIELPEIHIRLREILIIFRDKLASEQGRAVMEKTREETKRKLSLVGHL